MLKLVKQYRASYQGEDVITERKKEFQHWVQTVETVPNAITNNQISNRAVVIGNSAGREDFNLDHLKNPSGLLGATTLQTYGCNALFRDFTPDFLVATGYNIIKEIVNNPYTTENIVYTNAINLLEYPNKFYLIPHDPYADSGTTAAYIAAFDGHKTIYLLGFDEQASPNHNFNIYAGTNGYDAIDENIISDKWVDNRRQLFDTYNEVDWVWVTPYGRSTVPAAHKPCTNFRQISYRDFVIECDL
jgi:hypothetical protein